MAKPLLSGQITIKDPQEYNDYTNAVGQSTPAAKASAIETFLTKYPNSQVKNDLLEQLMASYQAAGDMAKTLSTADRLLAVDPGNIRALFIEVYLEESQAATKTRRPNLSPFYDKAAAQAQTCSQRSEAGKHVRCRLSKAEGGDHAHLRGCDR